MPKDPARNIDRYKISGGHLNEFEFHKNQAEMAEEAERFRAQTARKAMSESSNPAAKKAGTKAGKRRKKKSVG
jgi:hypothetical protein